MKNASKSVLVILLALSASIAFAQHRGGYNGGQRGGYSGGHNSVQHNGYSGGHNSVQHNGGYRHGGYGWVAPLMLGAGVAYLVSRQQPVYYQQPIIVETPLPIQCGYVQQQVTDVQGRPLYDRYTGRPLVRSVSFCPVTQ